MIQIIDGFKLNASTPIDSRFVVANDTERNGIAYKYHGLRVWQLSDNKPYFFDGVNWKSELDLVVTGTGSSDFIPKVTNSNPLQINDSQISDDGTTVSITDDLSVGRDITFSGNLNGQLNAGNITSGTLNLSRLETGNPGYVLRMESGVPTWVSLSSISIGSSTNTESVKVTATTSSKKYKLILREDGSSLGGYLPLYSYGSGLLFSNSSGSMCILAHDGNSTNPPYSFKDSNGNSTGTGMYSPGSNQIGFSAGGVEKVRIDTNGFKTIDGSKSKPSISFINSQNMGIYRNTQPPGVNYMVLVNGSNNILQIETDAVTFGDINTFSPRIRTGTQTSPDFPSYTWWGNDKTGMYRPSNDEIGFSIGGDVKMKIDNNGVSIKTSQYDNPDADENPIVFNNINSIGVPIGGIIIWSGDPANIGTGNLWNFAECDGTSTPSTVSNNGVTVNVVWSGSNLPNLAGRFALGSDNTYTTGQSEGNSKITEEHLPNHKHGPGTLNITSSGEHQHAIADDHEEVGTNFQVFRQGKNDRSGESLTQNVPNYEGKHTHSSSDFKGETGDGGFQNIDFLPPYYVVTYIIRLV